MFKFRFFFYNCVSVIDFLGFSPSTIAAAAVLCAAKKSVDFAAAEDREAASLFHERVNKVYKSTAGSS